MNKLFFYTNSIESKQPFSIVQNTKSVIEKVAKLTQTAVLLPLKLIQEVYRLTVIGFNKLTKKIEPRKFDIKTLLLIKNSAQVKINNYIKTVHKYVIVHKTEIIKSASIAATISTLIAFAYYNYPSPTIDNSKFYDVVKIAIVALTFLKITSVGVLHLRNNDQQRSNLERLRMALKITLYPIEPQRRNSLESFSRTPLNKERYGTFPPRHYKASLVEVLYELLEDAQIERQTNLRSNLEEYLSKNNSSTYGKMIYYSYNSLNIVGKELLVKKLKESTSSYPQLKKSATRDQQKQICSNLKRKYRKFFKASKAHLFSKMREHIDPKNASDLIFFNSLSDKHKLLLLNIKIIKTKEIPKIGNLEECNILKEEYFTSCRDQFIKFLLTKPKVEILCCDLNDFDQFDLLSDEYKLRCFGLEYLKD